MRKGSLALSERKVRKWWWKSRSDDEWWECLSRKVLFQLQFSFIQATYASKCFIHFSRMRRTSLFMEENINQCKREDLVQERRREKMSRTLFTLSKYSSCSFPSSSSSSPYLFVKRCPFLHLIRAENLFFNETFLNSVSLSHYSLHSTTTLPPSLIFSSSSFFFEFHESSLTLPSSLWSARTETTNYNVILVTIHIYSYCFKSPSYTL